MTDDDRRAARVFSPWFDRVLLGASAVNVVILLVGDRSGWWLAMTATAVVAPLAALTFIRYVRRELTRGRRG